MTDTSSQRIVYLDEIIGEEGVNEVLHEDGMLDSGYRDTKANQLSGWPNFGLRFSPSANVSHYLSLLQQYAISHQPDSPFEVYTRDTMPERYHFSNNERIAPIYICPRLGWIVSNHHEAGGGGRPKGVSVLSCLMYS
jgi:hypothetical protein